MNNFFDRHERFFANAFAFVMTFLLLLFILDVTS